MQTFLPYNSFSSSMQVLDNKRLNKQILEAIEILNITHLNKESKWKNHPAVLMWKGYPEFLALYICLACQEWWSRGYTSHKESFELVKNIEKPIHTKELVPIWLGDELFHSSHRSNLLLKDEFYLQYEWKELNEPYIPYVWPTWYSNFNKKIITKEGYQSLLKGLKRRNIKLEDCNQYWKFE